MQDSLMVEAFKLAYNAGNGVGSDLLILTVFLTIVLIAVKSVK